MADAQELALLGGGKEDVDQDLMLARILQEQERAFHALMSSSLQTGGSSLPNSSYYGAASSADGSEGEIDDEELARRLQSEEDQQMYQQQQQQEEAFLELEFGEDEELNYDQLGYEDLNAIGDVVGKVSKGLQPEVVSQLPVLQVQHIKQQQRQKQQPHCCSKEQAGQHELAQKAYQASSLCAICQMEYANDDNVKMLPCCHLYHQECVDQWLGMNKTCPICNKEVTITNSSKGSDKLAAAAAAAADAVTDTQACP